MFRYTYTWVDVVGTTAAPIEDSDSDGLPDNVGTSATAPRTSQLRFTATDVSGNTNECFTDVFVVDLQDPTATCPTSVTVSRTLRCTSALLRVIAM